MQGWREVGTVGVFVGQPGCKVIRGKRLKFSAVKVQQLMLIYMDTWATIMRVQVRLLQ